MEYLEQENNLYDGPSKSQVKREMKDILRLGRKIIELPFSRVQALNLPEKVEESIALAQRIKSREGKRRQTHYVGKLLRQVDTDAIAQQLEEWENGSKEEANRVQYIERLRDLMLTQDEAVADWINQNPSIDIQAFRSLVRAARKEQVQNTQLTQGQDPKKKHFRALFQMIKEQVKSLD